MREINKELERVNKRFLNKDMTEATFTKLKSELEAKKARLETLLDIVSM